jgi:hypothetical protein
MPTKYNLFGVLTTTGPPLSPGHALEVELIKNAEFITVFDLKLKVIVVVIGA